MTANPAFSALVTSSLPANHPSLAVSALFAESHPDFILVRADSPSGSSRRASFRTLIESTSDFGQPGSYVKGGTYRVASCISKTLRPLGALYVSELSYSHLRERERIGVS
jgi:hypothetical protein